MNEKIKTFLPKREGTRYPEMRLSPVQIGRNEMLDEIMAILDKHEVGIVPSLTDMSNIIRAHIFLTSAGWVLHDNGADKISMKIRQLMLGKE